MNIKDQPHYELAAAELAAWLERQGRGSWWSVDGDPLLMGRVSFPCAAEELARVIRRIGKPLLVLDRHQVGSGGTVAANDLDGLAEIDDSSNRVFAFAWDLPGSPPEWLLVEDKAAALVAQVMSA